MNSLRRYSLRALLIVTTFAALGSVFIAYYFQLGAFAKKPLVQTLEAFLDEYPHAEVIEKLGVDEEGIYEVLAVVVCPDSNGPGAARIGYAVDGLSRDVQVTLAKEYSAILCAEFREPVTRKRGYVVLGIGD